MWADNSSNQDMSKLLSWMSNFFITIVNLIWQSKSAEHDKIKQYKFINSNWTKTKDGVKELIRFNLVQCHFYGVKTGKYFSKISNGKDISRLSDISYFSVVL